MVTITNAHAQGRHERDVVLGSLDGFPTSRKARLSRGSDYDYGRRRTTAPSARTARTPRQLVFSCCLIFVRTNAAFSASVLRPVARWVPLVSERELPPLALLAWAARLQVLFAAVSPLALCVSPSFPSSVFPRRYALDRKSVVR